jgi:hypothetical protein
MNWLSKADVIPTLYATQEIADPVCQVKLFTPDSSWSWYIIEKDINSDLCFGYVIGLEAELGYFTLDELKGVRGSLGLSIERDLYFTPTRLSVVQRRER